MENITTVGIDLAKSVFQVNAIDESGKIIIGKAVRRRDFLGLVGKMSPCLIGPDSDVIAPPVPR